MLQTPNSLEEALHFLSVSIRVDHLAKKGNITESLLELFEGGKLDIDGRTLDSHGALEHGARSPLFFIPFVFTSDLVMVLLVPGPVVHVANFFTSDCQHFRLLVNLAICFQLGKRQSHRLNPVILLEIKLDDLLVEHISLIILDDEQNINVFLASVAHRLLVELDGVFERCDKFASVGVGLAVHGQLVYLVIRADQFFVAVLVGSSVVELELVLVLEADVLLNLGNILGKAAKAGRDSVVFDELELLRWLVDHVIRAQDTHVDVLSWLPVHFFLIFKHFAHLDESAHERVFLREVL